VLRGGFAKMGIMGRPKDLQVSPRRGQWTVVGEGAAPGRIEHGRRAGSLSPREGPARGKGMPPARDADGAAPPSRMATGGGTGVGTGMGSRAGTGAFLYGGESLEARAEARSRAGSGSRAGFGSRSGTGQFLLGDMPLEKRAEERSMSGKMMGDERSSSMGAVRPPVTVGIMAPSRFGPSASTLFKQRSTVPIAIPALRSVQMSQARSDFDAMKPDTPTYMENFIERRANRKVKFGHLGRYAEEALLSGFEPFETNKGGSGNTGLGWK